MDIDRAVSASLRRLVQRSAADSTTPLPGRGSPHARAGMPAAAAPAGQVEAVRSAATRQSLLALVSARSHLCRALAISDALR